MLLVDCKLYGIRKKAEVASWSLIFLSICNKFIEFVKMYIPVKIITIRPNDKPWFNSSIRSAMRIRDGHTTMLLVDCKLYGIRKKAEVASWSLIFLSICITSENDISHSSE
jgi:hypothetical protein